MLLLVATHTTKVWRFQRNSASSLGRTREIKTIRRKYQKQKHRRVYCFKRTIDDSLPLHTDTFYFGYRFVYRLESFQQPLF